MRPWVLAIYTILVLGAATMVVLATKAWKHRNDTPAAGPFTALLLVTAIYAAGYACELLSTTVPSLLFWVRVEYIGIALIPALWLIVVIEYTGNEWFLRPIFYIAIFTIPIITLTLVYTTNYHQLYYQNITTVTRGAFVFLSHQKGPWYRVNAGYTGFTLIAGMILIATTYLKNRLSTGKQAGILLVGLVPVLAIYLIFVAGVWPYEFDLLPFAFIIAIMIWVQAFRQHQSLGFVPLARDTVFETMQEGVVVFDARLRIADFNKAACRVFPSLTTTSIGKQSATLLADYPEVIACLDSRENQVTTITAASGRHYRCYISFIGHNRGIKNAVIVINDITDLVTLQDELQRSAQTDALTQLFNRRYLMETGQIFVKQAHRYHRSLCLAIVDLESFKAVNDTYGHFAGDAVLQTVAQILSDNVRQSDIVVRYGGDEFVLLLPETQVADGITLADRLVEVIAKATIIAGSSGTMQITVSIGLCCMDNDHQSLDALLQSADEALYRAKRAGGNCVEVYGI